ncbi:sugar lactone lactonase YvrE [Aliiruegeria haliotis]|uniref:Sugar lactone lactonase YvrE n=1 Tax=Aliiruegeria haliotis TaxID=1280846 RepID=A0A2T0RN34_9RHOB|nr:SMP-30/gluconolactonase/LRE family protein [Aliiruegeria haliotis]PRY22599.1 sugar lactone lactonase YvrE [Aliiruegeria haliotis]
MTTIFDPTICTLGEGPLWHPSRNQLFWFDIIQKKLLTREDDKTRGWDFKEHVSAAGWISDTQLLVASESALFSFDLDSGAQDHVAPLEADNPVTRSNDGRADPWGGFWIGTMGFNAEPGAGAIYRYYRGEVRKIIPDISITNAICFDPEGGFACYCDTAEHVVRKIRLSEADGWPVGESEIFLDFRSESWGPDGAVMGADGTFWNAQWGASRVAAYDRSGALVQTVEVPAQQASCPAFGGPDLTTLFVTSAMIDLPAETLADQPENGMTFAIPDVAKGQREHKVIL